jgi:hypothetical protein
MSDSQPLFVRLPAPAAQRLERIASISGASKREVVTRLILGNELRFSRSALLDWLAGDEAKTRAHDG